MLYAETVYLPCERFEKGHRCFPFILYISVYSGSKQYILKGIKSPLKRVKDLLNIENNAFFGTNYMLQCNMLIKWLIMRID
jgi:hypothetical protein